MGKLAEKLARGERVLTAEISPPKGAGIKKLVKHAESIGGLVDAINITDCQRALVKMSSMAASRVLLDHGFEPVFQLTCRDRNSIALQSDLMGAYALGIPNVLCLTGDPVKVGDSPQSKSVFEVESVRLLQLASQLQGGRDGSGAKMNAPTKFLLGAVVNPIFEGAGSQWLRFEKKIEAGARFFQTQANYNIDDFAKFMEKTKSYGVPVLGGILILHSAEIAAFIHENIPGIRLPESVLSDFKNSSDPEDYGIEFAVRTMLAAEEHVRGFHLMSVRHEEIIPKVLERYHARKRPS